MRLFYVYLPSRASRKNKKNYCLLLSARLSWQMMINEGKAPQGAGDKQQQRRDKQTHKNESILCSLGPRKKQSEQELELEQQLEPEQVLSVALVLVETCVHAISLWLPTNTTFTASPGAEAVARAAARAVASIVARTLAGQQS